MRPQTQFMPQVIHEGAAFNQCRKTLVLYVFSAIKTRKNVNNSAFSEKSTPKKGTKVLILRILTSILRVKTPILSVIRPILRVKTPILSDFISKNK